MTSNFKEVYQLFTTQHQNKDYKGTVESILNIPTEVLPKYANYYKSLVFSSMSAFVRIKCTCIKRMEHLRRCCKHLFTFVVLIADQHSTVAMLESVFLNECKALAGLAPLLLDFINEMVVLTITMDSRGTDENMRMEYFSIVCYAIVLTIKIEVFTGLITLAHACRLVEDCSRIRPKDVHFRNFRYAVQLFNEPSRLIDNIKREHNNNFIDQDLLEFVVIGHILSLIQPLFPKSDPLSAINLCEYLVDGLKRNKEPSKLFSVGCRMCKDVVAHVRLQLAAVAFKNISQIISDQDQIKEVPDNLFNLILDEMTVAHQINCQNQSYFVQLVQFHISSIMRCDRPEVSTVLLAFLENMCRQLKDIDIIEKYLSRSDFFKFLRFHTYLSNENNNALFANYLEVINVMSSKEYSKANGVFTVLKMPLLYLCSEQNKRDELFDIVVALNEINWTYMDVIPIERVDLADLYVHILHYSSTAQGILSSNLRLQLAHRILDLFTTIDDEHDRLQCLRVTNGFPFADKPKEIFERLQPIVEEMKKHPPVREKTRFYALCANMDFFDYIVHHNDTVEECRNESFDSRNIESLQIFSKQNVTKECCLVRKLQSALFLYSKFVQKVDAKTCNNECAWETNFVVNALWNIGQHLSMRLFRDDAMKAFRLLLLFARRIDDEKMQLRAITHIVANAQYFADMEGEDSLKEIIEHGSELLARTVTQYGNMSTSRQRVALLCMMNVGLYYIDSGRKLEGKELLRFAEKMLGEMEEKIALKSSNNRKCMLRLRHTMVLLELVIKHRFPSPFPIIRFTEMAMKSVGEIRGTWPDEVPTLITILFETLWNVTQYSLARYDFGEVEPVMGMMLKLAGRNGCAYILVRILVAWAHIELYKESHVQCLNKLTALDFLLPADTDPKKQSSVAMKPVGVVGSNTFVIREDETPGKLPPLSKYLIEHAMRCQCFICKRPFIQRVFFELATIYGRLLYVQQDFEHSLNAFRETHAFWLRRRHLFDTSQLKLNRWDRQDLSYALYRMFWYFGQCLKRSAQFDDSLEMYQEALEYASQGNDMAIIHELKIEIASIKKTDLTIMSTGLKNNRLKTAECLEYTSLHKGTSPKERPPLRLNKYLSPDSFKVYLAATKAAEKREKENCQKNLQKENLVPINQRNDFPEKLANPQQKTSSKTSTYSVGHTSSATHVAKQSKATSGVVGSAQEPVTAVVDVKEKAKKKSKKSMESESSNSPNKNHGVAAEAKTRKRAGVVAVNANPVAAVTTTTTRVTRAKRNAQ